MTTKEYLNQYRNMRYRIDRCRERLRLLRASVGSTGGQGDGMPRGGGISKPTETQAVKLAETEAKLEDMILEAEAVRQEIADEIENVDGAVYQTLLYSRYVIGLSWEDTALRVSAHRPLDRPYDPKHVRGYMHAEALRRFEAVRKY